jgi:hypothetical protein
MLFTAWEVRIEKILSPKMQGLERMDQGLFSRQREMFFSIYGPTKAGE